MTYQCVPEEIIKAWGVLGIRIRGGEFGEVRLIGRGNPTQKWYDSPDQIAKDIDSFIKLVGPHYNSYIGRAPRNKDGGSSTEDIDYIGCWSIDLDSPKRPKEHPASEQEVAEVKEQAMKVVAQMNIDGIHPVVIMSGNGYQIWVPFDTQLDVIGRRKWLSLTAKNFESHYAQFVDPAFARIDPQHDLARIVKLPGTWSFKGIEKPEEQRVYRIASFVVSDWMPTDPMALLQKFGAPEIKPEMVVVHNVPIPEKFWHIIESDSFVCSLWTGTAKDLKDNSPSGQDFALIRALRHRGFSASEAAAVLKYKPTSKAGSRPDYIEMTVRKVYDAA